MTDKQGKMAAALRTADHVRKEFGLQMDRFVVAIIEQTEPDMNLGELAFDQAVYRFNGFSWFIATYDHYCDGDNEVLRVPLFDHTWYGDGTTRKVGDIKAALTSLREDGNQWEARFHCWLEVS